MEDLLEEKLMAWLEENNTVTEKVHKKETKESKSGSKAKSTKERSTTSKDK